jgi:hypothetical protein
MESGGDIVGSALVIRGRGYPEEDGGTTFDPGAAFTLRLGKAWRRVALFGAAGVNWWMRTQRVFVTGAGEMSSNLPRFEGTVGLGMSWRARM